jgi:uncharacterized protein
LGGLFFLKYDINFAVGLAAGYATTSSRCIAMLPKFPKFKKLELSDKADIEKITSQYPPYSDFNFVSMWSWDIKGEMRVSECHGNLIVRFTDYISGHAFYSFLGNHSATETALELIQLSKKEGLGDRLKLVPEDAIKSINRNTVLIEEDPDNFDYILPIQHLKDYSTKKMYSKRKSVNALLKQFTPEIKILDLSHADIQHAVFDLITDKAIFDNKVVENELLAVSRFMTGHQVIGSLPIGLYMGRQLAGFCFSEVLNDKYATSHFWKANTKISPSLYSYLMQSKARLLHNRGYEYLNIEQDLGIENLRKWKNSFGSEMFLKKHTLQINPR